MMPQFWNTLRISAKFAVSYGVLLLLLVMIALTGYFGLSSVYSGGVTIQISSEIKDLVLEMEHAMEKARRFHGDFFMQYPLIGFTKAHNLYARQSAQQMTIVLQNSARLKEMLGNPKVSVFLRHNNVDLNLYIASAKRFSETSTESIQLIKELADPMDGLEIMFEHTTAALQMAIADYTSPKEHFNKMISFSKDYLITHQRHFMQSSFNTLVFLRRAIENQASQPEDEKQNTLMLLDQWREIAEKILAVDVKIKGKIHDFSLQTETTDPVSATLIRLANEEVQFAQSRISQSYRFAAALMAAITVTGLILAITIARVLNMSITANIIRLTRFTEAFQQGNLNVRTEEEGADELGRLAHAFNSMAARIRELVDHLEQKVLERTAALAESEERFRAIIENTTQGILIADTATMKFLYANPAIAGMFGYGSPEELMDKEVADLHPATDLQYIENTFRKMAEKKVRFVSDVPCLRKNGAPFVADIVAGEVNFGGRTCLAGFFLETTEKRNLQAQLERARKMEAIGLLAGGVAHDLNNILSGIVSYPELLLLQLPPDSTFRKPLHAIHESGKRAAAVVSDLLTVARGVASTREPADLNRLILDYLASPEHIEIQSSHAHVTCRKDLDPNLANISCSPIHIKKCILNLMMNAMEAIDAEGLITISTRNQDLSESDGKNADLHAGKYAVLTVADSGHGIKHDDLEHIFEPFYTKKIMGKSGTGLGLAVVWNSVQDHGGAITVESGERGTRFHLFFPATDQRPPTHDTQASIEELRGNGESVLVIDDEQQQLDITNRILSSLGYDVHCVNSGEEAVEYMRKGRADIMLLDMIMDPGINGLQTYERILRLHPGQKAIIASGFAESDNVRMTQRLGARGFILKPFSIEQLGRAVKNELQRTEATGNISGS